MKTYTMTAQILQIKRRPCSIYGNPNRTILFLYDGELIEGKTASNSSAGYSIDNRKEGEFIKIRGHYTKKENFIIDYILDN